MSESDVPTPEQVEAIWGRLTRLRAQLCVSVTANPGKAVDTMLSWFTDGFERLGGIFREAALTLSPDELAIDARIAGRAPGGISVAIGVMSHARDYDTPSPPYSEKTWADLRRRLRGVPPLAFLDCVANNDSGQSSGPFLVISAQRFDRHGGTWVLLEALGSPELLGGDAQRAQLLTLLRDTAQHCDPVHAEISWGKGGSPSLLEGALAIEASASLASAREFLRSYGWLTVIPEELGTQLGGVDALRASGAFVEVDHLRGGGYWCRATQRLEDYDQPAAERVFDAVAAVLPPGEPNAWAVHPPNVLSLRAASAARSGRS